MQVLTPNIRELWADDLLLYLGHGYKVTKSAKGDIIYRVLELLLSYGANPNNVGSNNWRAIDGFIERKDKELIDLFIRYGADPLQREFI